MEEKWQVGYVFQLDDPSTTTSKGICVFCAAKTYSLEPLALASCLNCPVGADCSMGGKIVSFASGNWKTETRMAPQNGINAPVLMHVLQFCSQGHKVVNTLEGASNFSHDSQTCVLCDKGEECSTPDCTKCTMCSPGKVS